MADAIEIEAIVATTLSTWFDNEGHSARMTGSQVPDVLLA